MDAKLTTDTVRLPTQAELDESSNEIDWDALDEYMEGPSFWTEDPED